MQRWKPLEGPQFSIVEILPLQSDLVPLTSFYNSFMLPVLTGLAAAGAASAAGYQSMAPTGQWYGRTFAAGKRESRRIALTYDDGPNDPHTLKLLEVLGKHGVHATFFMIGRFVRESAAIARAVAAAGHRNRQSYFYASAADLPVGGTNPHRTRGLSPGARRHGRRCIPTCFARPLAADAPQRCASRANWDLRL